MKRRSFVKTIPTLGVLSFSPAVLGNNRPNENLAPDDRTYWWQLLERISLPVLENMSQGKLRQQMPVETASGEPGNRPEVTHLEALGRTLAGIAPWLELPEEQTLEGKSRKHLQNLALLSVKHGVDPKSPDYLNWTVGGQPLVDGAFLAHALLRAPKALWDPLDQLTKQRLIDEFHNQRLEIKPVYNNWLLFGAMIDAFLFSIGERGDLMRMDFAIKKHQEWYLGDGWYGDGPEFHLDYYNAFVIHSMMVQVLEVAAQVQSGYQKEHEIAVARMKRYAGQQEMLISPEGTFPAFGRSITYRSGAFQPLAEMVLKENIPEKLTYGQIRAALTKVYTNIFESEGVFDSKGWLQLGLAGHQPRLAESYISTGSLYLCTVGFLPLGLPENHPFWTDAPQPWTNQKVWGGQDVVRDQAMGK